MGAEREKVIWNVVIIMSATRAALPSPISLVVCGLNTDTPPNPKREQGGLRFCVCVCMSSTVALRLVQWTIQLGGFNQFVANCFIDRRWQNFVLFCVRARVDISCACACDCVSRCVLVTELLCLSIRTWPWDSLYRVSEIRPFKTVTACVSCSLGLF